MNVMAQAMLFLKNFKLYGYGYFACMYAAYVLRTAWCPRSQEDIGSQELEL